MAVVCRLGDFKAEPISEGLGPGTKITVIFLGVLSVMIGVVWYVVNQTRIDAVPVVSAPVGDAPALPTARGYGQKSSFAAINWGDPGALRSQNEKRTTRKPKRKRESVYDDLQGIAVGETADRSEIDPRKEMAKIRQLSGPLGTTSR